MCCSMREVRLKRDVVFKLHPRIVHMVKLVGAPSKVTDTIFILCSCNAINACRTKLDFCSALIPAIKKYQIGFSHDPINAIYKKH